MPSESAVMAPRNTKQTGDETEAQIIAALIEHGYSVSIPFGDNDRYDLVVDTEHGLRRVQCKTGWIEDEVVRFKTASKTTVDGTVALTDYDGDIDAFAVRCKDTDELYWVPLEAAGRKTRISDSRNPKSIIRTSSEPRGIDSNGDFPDSRRENCPTALSLENLII